MRIKEISITDLFGMFNHVIPLNLEERITIIYGINGVGKTTLLKLINGVFQLEGFKNGEIFNLHSQGLESRTISLIFPPKELGFSNILFEQLTIDFDNNIYLNINKKENIMHRKEENILSVYNLVHEYNPENFIKVRLIEHDRLLNLAANNDNHQSLLHSVANYAQELAKNIQAKLTEYGTLSQSLDRTFPARAVQQNSLPKLTDEKFKDKLIKLEKKRSKLIDYGLLNTDENTDIQISGDIDESTKKILAVYIEDTEKKLSLFDDIASKIDVLKRIINNKFYCKHINISKDQGFTFTTDDGNSLSPTNLSSGEQHELVLLYELLFKVKPNSLILIDEPELSLHVEWQVQFLKDLQEITKLSNIDVLIATHSPDIIHDRWDLTVELKGPGE